MNGLKKTAFLRAEYRKEMDIANFQGDIKNKNK
jgi:hypothetical protein